MVGAEDVEEKIILINTYGGAIDLLNKNFESLVVKLKAFKYFN